MLFFLGQNGRPRQDQNWTAYVIMIIGTMKTTPTSAGDALRSVTTRQGLKLQP